MEKNEPPKPPGTKDVDQGGQEGNRSFGTDDIWKNALKKFQTDNQIDDAEMKNLVQAGDLGDADLELKKRLSSLRLGDIPQARILRP